MKIRLISDLHQEFFEDKTLYKNHGEDLLVIAGDLAVGYANCQRALQQFETKQIVYVPGNHEYYGTTTNTFDHHMQRWCAEHGVYYLNPGTVVIGGVHFIGAALWTNFNNNPLAELEAQHKISDFRHISGLTPQGVKNLYQQHLAFIQAQLQKHQGPKVVITHWLPAQACVALQFRGPSLLNHYWANGLDQWISTLQNTTWFFGHTHTPMDLSLGTTRLVANPYGYNHNLNYREILINVHSN